MFQDTTDMPGMGNELYRAKKKLEEQKIINQDLQKNISSMTEHSTSLFCI